MSVLWAFKIGFVGFHLTRFSFRGIYRGAASKQQAVIFFCTHPRRAARTLMPVHLLVWWPINYSCTIMCYHHEQFTVEETRKAKTPACRWASHLCWDKYICKSSQDFPWISGCIPDISATGCAPALKFVVRCAQRSRCSHRLTLTIQVDYRLTNQYITVLKGHQEILATYNEFLYHTMSGGVGINYIAWGRFNAKPRGEGGGWWELCPHTPEMSA